MKPIIEVKNLIKKYNKAEKNAVDNISFSVGEGEFFAFLGPNGAGKTTTISILTTILAKTSGTVTIAGYDIEKNQSEIRRSIGIIFQNPSLDLNLTAEENIRLHAILYGLYPYRPTYNTMSEAYRKKVKDLSDVVGIGGEIFKTIKTFSGGMKRKLEIMRGLMHEPKVLFLDEPTIGLDPMSRRAVWDYLKEVRKKMKTTIFLTTHYLDEVEPATHVGIINHGKIVSFGTPDSIKKQLMKDYLIVDSPNRKDLIGELKRKKISYKEEGYVLVELKNKSAQQMIQSIDTSLSHLKIHTPTFEDAYLAVIKENNESKT